jgi:hypothetical protein
MADDRRRSKRLAVEIPARLLLDDGVEAEVVVKNIGDLGALLSLSDLEVTVREGDRSILDYPDPSSKSGKKRLRRSGAVVRVDMELVSRAVVRQLAVFFDDGPSPRPPAA